MKRFLLPAATALGLFAAPLAAQPAAMPSPDAGLPDWLAGYWQMEDGANWGDEVWMRPRGGLMIGAARMGFGSELRMWETTRIVRKADGRISFLAQPQGKPPTEFPMVHTSDFAIEFANPASDYPQRIRYERVGQLLIAEISKLDGSDRMRWQYRPVEQ